MGFIGCLHLMDEQGNIDAKPINNEGGNNFDVIYNKKNYSEETRKDYDVSGNKTGIAVSKQVIENHHKTTLNITDVAGSKTGEVKTNDKYTTKNDAEAQLLMNFVNKNTNVEWSNTLMSRNGQALNVVMTSHELQTVSYSSEQLQKYSNVGYSIIRNDHIHPDQFSFTSSIPDRRMKNWFLDNNKDIITRILFKGRYYPF